MTALQSNNGSNSTNNAIKANAVKDTTDKVQETSKVGPAKTANKTPVKASDRAKQMAKDKAIAANKDRDARMSKAAEVKEEAKEVQEVKQLKDVEKKVPTSKLVKASEMELTTGRNFYAVKTTPKGKEVHYAFETVNERNHWLNRHADSKPTDARSVYRMLKRASNEVVATTRNHRVIKLNYDELVDPTKGARALIK